MKQSAFPATLCEQKPSCKRRGGVQGCLQRGYCGGARGKGCWAPRGGYLVLVSPPRGIWRRVGDCSMMRTSSWSM